ncbi:Alpha/Beta hydrolase protein [Dactylonectria macrodidyma]|uniref:Alpha/Beta hydrolase protein n=1 Tax=Dactylonectria macrodidyma TaxID=307937 RepID=A0A9P9JFF1_9HYPO|nr:Alpha/Beta hydrolase protein [Dactylonectria macrodidyma]
MARDDPAQTAPAGGSGNEIFPYRIHVSNKYLDITRQKLELTRLPHEPRSREWWEPKPQVESLIDYWQEHYSWSKHEEKLNAAVPQFRTSFQTPPPQSAVRIHFIHVRSPHANAVPLLLIPPFPLTNLSLTHLVSPLTGPQDAAAQQPFHLVIPALPGLGFSDPLPNSAPPISTTASMLDGLMKRLGYQRYIATNTSSASLSPAKIDWRLVKHLSQHYLDSCLGAHLISPPLDSPKIQQSAVEWGKWTLARIFSSPILGYSKDDFSAKTKPDKSQSKGKKTLLIGQLSSGGWEPNTPAYALCDSPTGLLLCVLKTLRTLGPKRELKPDDIITLTQLIWLPGPEAALRFWALCSSQIEPVETKKPSRKPRVAVTVFLGNDEQSDQQKTLPQPAKNEYACPGWARTEFQVLHSNRVTGKPGFLAWDRPEVIVDGVRDLAKAVLAVDKSLKVSDEASTVPQPPAAPIERPPTTPAPAPADLSGSTVQGTFGAIPESTEEGVPETPGKNPLMPGFKEADPSKGKHLAVPQTPKRPSSSGQQVDT